MGTEQVTAEQIDLCRREWAEEIAMLAHDEDCAAYWVAMLLRYIAQQEARIADLGRSLTTREVQVIGISDGTLCARCHSLAPDHTDGCPQEKLEQGRYCEMDPGEPPTHNMANGMICIQCWNKVCEERNQLQQDSARDRSARDVLMIERDAARHEVTALRLANTQLAMRDAEQPRPAAGVDEEVERIRARQKVRDFDTLKNNLDNAQKIQATYDCGNMLLRYDVLRLEYDRSAQECAELRAKADKSERLDRAVMDYWQARFNVLCDAWRDGNNDAVLDACRKFIKANDQAEAQAKLEETSTLRAQINDLTQECAGLRAERDSARSAGAEYIARTDPILCGMEQLSDENAELKARLASHDACLAQVREEMPGVEEIRATIAELKNYWAGRPGDVPLNMSRYFEHGALLLEAIDKLQSTEGANRNAIKTAQETIATLKSDLSAQITQRLESGLKFAECLERANAAEARERGLREALQSCRLALLAWPQSLDEFPAQRAALAKSSAALAASDGQQSTPKHPDSLRLDWLNGNCVINPTEDGQRWVFHTPSHVENECLRSAIDSALRDGRQAAAVEETEVGQHPDMIIADTVECLAAELKVHIACLLTQAAAIARKLPEIEATAK